LPLTITAAAGTCARNSVPSNDRRGQEDAMRGEGRRVVIWRRGARFLSGALALLVTGGAALLASEAAGWRFLRPALEQRLGAAAGVPVVIGEPFRARLLRSPQISLQRLTVGVSAGLPAPHLLDASHVRLSWRWADLWAASRGDVLRVRELEMASLDLHLVRDAQGRASWQLGAATPARGWQPPLIERVAVHGGNVNVDDRPHALRLRTPIEPLSLHDEVPGSVPRLILTRAAGAAAAHGAP
jgi:uncharacterized protein involved in outer membrane biogenesis